MHSRRTCHGKHRALAPDIVVIWQLRQCGWCNFRSYGINRGKFRYNWRGGHFWHWRGIEHSALAKGLAPRFMRVAVVPMAVFALLSAPGRATSRPGVLKVTGSGGRRLGAVSSAGLLRLELLRCRRFDSISGLFFPCVRERRRKHSVALEREINRRRGLEAAQAAALHHHRHIHTEMVASAGSICFCVVHI